MITNARKCVSASLILPTVYKPIYPSTLCPFRFDFDGNGLIDVFELQRLLNYLGVKCDQEYVKDLIEESDRDHDGMLSFSDVSLF